MPLVAAKCTQCGANIEVDNTKEAGICKFCGTAFITEKAITNYNTYVTNNNSFAGANINVVGGDINNFIKLANIAIESKNGQEAFDYSNKALEIQADSSEAWLVKMKSIEFLGTIGNPRLDEVVSYGNNAIKYALEDNKKEIQNEVYLYMLSRAVELMTLALLQVCDTAQVENSFKLAGFNLAAISIVQNTDANTRSIIGSLTSQAIDLKLKVPDIYIKENEDAQTKIEMLAKLYVEYCEADVKRIKIYGVSLLPEAITAREKNLSLIKIGLSDEKASNIENDSVKTNNSEGCYIATCVYGSYDCPEVWTLRRYRDHTLKKSWYGRVFVKCYYTVSPILVKWFGNKNWFKSFWKSKLDKMVSDLNDNDINNTYYQDKKI